jgi:tetratricopeptide (TPR) repeat protein
MQGRSEEAVAEFREAIRLDPKSQGSYPNLASHLMNLGRVEEAYPLIQEAIRLDPRDPFSQYVLGFYLNRQGRFEDAIAPLREALRLSPDLDYAQASLRQALRQLGRWDESRCAPARGRRAAPTTQVVERPRVDAGRPRDACRDPQPGRGRPARAKAARLTERKVPPILDTLAFALHAHGDLGEAVKVQEEILRLLGGKDAGDYKLAHAEAALVRYQRAVEGAEQAN